eukprot:TRINITY_DN3599_c0_g1_i3.p1 TRINITY_DN3599_c0_g1~~TRINITY_DN3599_c0_g1_i3.p1  ORF type:complete len:365 (+),score=60.51 TRINITY_DN3599_c0_g1_i3:513-1607(+)
MRELSFIGKARSLLVESVHLVPCNWSAWLDIAALCPDRDVLRQLHVPTEHWIYRFFLGHVYLELQCTDDSLEIYHELSVNFPKNTYVLAQTAITHYNMQDFKESEQLFDMLNKWDPYRITNMDIYSNILYVTEKHAKLSYLAYKASSTDKFTPEANAIIGNYYSLKGDHVKAVIYFQRALALNPRYLSAWTLMGHEYLEMKNTNAAIPAYRKAVDINPRDYRYSTHPCTKHTPPPSNSTHNPDLDLPSLLNLFTTQPETCLCLYWQPQTSTTYITTYLTTTTTTTPPTTTYITTTYIITLPHLHLDHHHYHLHHHLDHCHMADHHMATTTCLWTTPPIHIEGMVCVGSELRVTVSASLCPVLLW